LKFFVLGPGRIGDDRGVDHLVAHAIPGPGQRRDDAVQRRSDPMTAAMNTDPPRR
jgi:hypothetical protein